MKRAVLHVISKLFLLQQRCADFLRPPLDADSQKGPSRGAWQKALFRCTIFLQAIMQRLIRPEVRSRLRLWLFRSLEAGSGSSDTSASEPFRIPDVEMEGITVIGYLKAEIGLGEGARSTIRAAKCVGIRVNGFDYRPGCSARWREDPDCELVSGSRSSQYVNLFHLNPDQIYVAYNVLGKHFFDGHYNIAYCVWEQADLPEEWVPAFGLFREVWTASRFCQDLISRKTDRPVIRIPHCVAPAVPAHSNRKTLGLPEEGFLFLGMVDFRSTPERKNPIGALEAFSRAFGSSSGSVFFVLKTMNSDIRKDIRSQMREYRDRCPSIILLDQYLERGQANALINSCNCFVSLHRAEGFGLPIAEAMYMEKPVIATGWSGNMDFMNVGNSFPVRHRMVEMENASGPYRKGNQWAEPEIDHAAQLMRELVDEPDLAASVARRARQEISTALSPLNVGRMIQDRLQRIAKGFT